MFLFRGIGMCFTPDKYHNLGNFISDGIPQTRATYSGEKSYPQGYP